MGRAVILGVYGIEERGYAPDEEVVMTTRSGRCMCGAVRFEAEVPRESYVACHCGTCRRQCGGSPFFGVETTRVTLEGEENVGRYASSGWAERGFCTRCGTVLFYFLKPASSYSMSVGTFDEASAFRLESEIFVDEKPAGYAFTGEHPRLTAAEAMASFSPTPS